MLAGSAHGDTIDRSVENLPPAPSTYGQRLRLLRNKRYNQWYFNVIGGPLGALANAVIADISWITPNLLTVVGFVIRLAAVPLILDGAAGSHWLAAGALIASTILDCMDGGLARYRKRPSVTGAFLDKVTDLISWIAISAALGYRAWLDTGAMLPVYAATFIGISYASRCYNWWIVSYFELEKGQVVATRAEGLEDLSFKQRLAYYARSTSLIVELGEGDVYLWLAIGLVTGHLREVLPALAVGMALWYVYLFIKRVRRTLQLDATAAAATRRPATGTSYLVRLRLLQNKQDDDWFALAFCSPLGSIVNAAIADVEAITPNTLTLLAFATRLCAIPLILADNAFADASVIGVFTLGTVLDCMDGGLARYRGMSSVAGAFLDKATDLVGLSLVCAAIALRVHVESGSMFAFYAALFIPASYAVRCYAYWIVAYFELERRVLVPTTGPRHSDKPASPHGVVGHILFSLRESWRIFTVGESDIYLWLGIGLVLSTEIAVLAVASAMAFWFVAVVGWRLAVALRMDRQRL
jgi:phosphatidylglycerophosphate synthase